MAQDVKLSKIATELFRTVSPVREIMNFADPSRLKDMGVNENELISFGGGWVNHNAPQELISAYREIINNESLFHYSGGYSPTNGEPLCKKALVDYEKSFYGMDGISENNIVIGQSSSELTYLLFTVLLDTDDAICLLDPSYCNFPLQIYSSVHSRLIRYPVVDCDEFTYNANDPNVIKGFTEFLVEHKPKAVLLVSPDNPCGQVLSDEFFNSTLEAVTSYGGALIVDFAYKEIVFGDYPKYFSAPPNGNYISIHSNSKWCRGLGRRLGWIEASENIAEAFESMQNTTILSPDRLHQIALSMYLDETLPNGKFEEYITEVRNLYKTTADVTCNAIEEYINLPYFRPEGGLYTCIKVGENSASFVEELLKKTGVLFVPGWGFGKSLAKAVRLSYGPLVYSHELIIDGLRKAGEYIKR